MTSPWSCHYRIDPRLHPGTVVMWAPLLRHQSANSSERIQWSLAFTAPATPTGEPDHGE